MCVAGSGLSHIRYRFNTLIQKKRLKKQPHFWSSKKMSLTLHLQILDLFYNNWLKRFSGIYPVSLFCRFCDVNQIFAH